MQVNMRLVSRDGRKNHRA